MCRKVLAHYDEKAKEGPKLTLGQGGTARDAGDAAADGGGTGGGAENRVPESLQVEDRLASEYFTTDEMAKFKKPKKVGGGGRVHARAREQLASRFPSPAAGALAASADCNVQRRG